MHWSFKLFLKKTVVKPFIPCGLAPEWHSFWRWGNFQASSLDDKSYSCGCRTQHSLVKTSLKKDAQMISQVFQVASLVSTLLIILGVKWKPCDFVKLQTWSAWRAGLQCVHWRCQPGESKKSWCQIWYGVVTQPSNKSYIVGVKL